MVYSKLIDRINNETSEGIGAKENLECANHLRTGGLLGRKPTILVDRSLSVPLEGTTDLVLVPALGTLPSLSPPVELAMEATEGAREWVGRIERIEYVDCVECADAVDNSSGEGSTDDVDDERLADLAETGEAILIVSSCSTSSNPISLARSCSSSD